MNTNKVRVVEIHSKDGYSTWVGKDTLIGKVGIFVQDKDKFAIEEGFMSGNFYADDDPTDEEYYFLGVKLEPA